MKKIILPLLVCLFIISLRASSQCAFDPTITGDTILCPNDSGMLVTQVYDSYQWHKRPFSGTYQPIPGATSQTLSIDAANDAGFYFRVEATLDTCTEFSPEVLVDSWVFLLPYTIIEGDYTIGGNGELILCQGDTILLLSSMPYDTNLQWYDNGNPIPGANNDTLIVTTAGSYTYSGAPSICPNFIQFQFVASDVVVINCGVGLNEAKNRIKLESNLVTDFLVLQDISGNTLEILDVRGSIVKTEKIAPGVQNLRFDVASIPAGSYFIRVSGNGYSACAAFIKM